MRFEWDERKAAANLLKHGSRFEDAITTFDDPWGLRAPDAAHSTVEEERIWLIGESDSAIVVVVFTERQPGRVMRIISARPANRKERLRYEESKRVPL